MSSTTTALSKLCQANLGILSQKLGLLEAMSVKHGTDKAKKFFQMSCPLVKASVGQHFRHSLDHIELAAKIAERPNDPNRSNLHYDLRERGCSSEHDMDAATERIINVINMLEVVSIVQGSNNNTNSSSNNKDSSVVQQTPVQAFFMLDGDSNSGEYALTSTIGRELGFAAHHAIHHMAMVKLIATQTVGLTENDLPTGFGRAPSTVRFDNIVQEEEEEIHRTTAAAENNNDMGKPSVEITHHKSS